MSRISISDAFDPEATKLMAAAFEKAWEALQANAVSAGADPVTREALAKAVIAAGRGQAATDVERLAGIALSAVSRRS